MKRLTSLLLAPCFLSLTLAAAVYEPQQGTAFGNLELTHNANRVAGVFHRGLGSFDQLFVMYIDSEDGGFSSTAGFTDNSSVLRRAVSGLGASGNRARVDFAPGFLADYAMVLMPSLGGVGLFKLSEGGEFEEASRNWLSFGPTDTVNAPTYDFTFGWEAVGLSSSEGFGFTTTYLNEYGFRRVDSYSTVVGPGGFGAAISFENANSYGTMVPEPSVAGLGALGGLMLALAVARRQR